MSLELLGQSDPVTLFVRWYAEAVAAPDPFADAMTLATATAEGRPSARMVLYKGLSAGEPRFFTNYESRKGRELEQNPRAALVFHWTSLTRQVRIEGAVERLSEAESDNYFASRERESQLGAWASQQSRALRDRSELEQRYAEFERKYSGTAVPRPPHWGGFRLVADAYEFWIGLSHRLHERARYERTEQGWTSQLLSP